MPLQNSLQSLRIHFLQLLFADNYADNYDEDDNGDDSDEWDSDMQDLEHTEKNTNQPENNSTHQLEWDPTADVAETSFNDEKLDKETLERIVNLIEDEKLRDSINFSFEAESDEKGEVSGKTLKDALIDGISDLNIEDRLNSESWDELDKKINLEEHEKFEYNQKVKIINTALENEREDGFFINPEDDKLYNFLQKFEPTFTDTKKEINGFNYNGEKIIKRTYKNPNDKKEGYTFVFLINETANQVIDQLDDISKVSFKNQLIAKIGDTGNIKTEAENYMEELRNIQKEKVKNATKIGELKERIRQINKTNEEIEKIKENQPIKIDEDVLEKSSKGRVIRFLKKYKIPVISAAHTWHSRINRHHPRGRQFSSQRSKKVAQLGSTIIKTGKTIEKIGKTMDKLTKYPVETLAAILKMFGYLVKETSLNPILLATLVAVLASIYIIKRWSVG